MSVSVGTFDEREVMRSLAICRACKKFFTVDFASEESWIRCKHDLGAVQFGAMYEARIVPDACLYRLEQIMETRDEQDESC
jgi:hypothetical protein